MKWDTEKEEKGWGGGVKNNVLKYQAYDNDININDMIFLKIFTGRNIFISFIVLVIYIVRVNRK